MRFNYTNYLELPAPLAICEDLLSDPTTWLALVPKTKQIGDLWQFDQKRYTVSFESPQKQQLQWQITPVKERDLSLTLELDLHDALISTHVIIRLVLEAPSVIWPWEYLTYKRYFGLFSEHCKKTLSKLLQERLIIKIKAEEKVAIAAVPLAAEQQNGAALTLNQASPAFAHKPKLAIDLHDLYPKTIENFEKMQALNHLARIQVLEAEWKGILNGEYAKDVYETTANLTAQAFDYDLIYAGGGLALLHAAAMAQCYGRRVLVFDRSLVGQAHREWNISRAELQALVDMGLMDWDELATVIMREYRTGIVRFYHSPYSKMPQNELWLPGVLNVAIDAQGLLQLMRQKIEAAGGKILDHRLFRRVRVAQTSPMQVEVELEATSSEKYTARLLVDGMGSTSPLTLLQNAGRPFAGLCPTVGTTATGFEPGNQPNQHNPTIGDILISVADTQSERQFIWEGFPGREDELTVYVFYYGALNGQQVKRERPAFSLLELFENYFTLLPSYKKPGANFRHLKPVYGYIPGRHSLQKQDAPLLRGVLPVGDSAAQQSPLTYCGFGAHVRNLPRTTSLLEQTLAANQLEPKYLCHTTAFQINSSFSWVFSRFMQPWGQPHNVNEIQNAFLGVLKELGPDLALRFYQDRMYLSDYNQIIWQMLLKYPVVLSAAPQVLGIEGVYQWLRDYINLGVNAALATGAAAAGAKGEHALDWLAAKNSLDLGLMMQARYAEWRVMGWLPNYPAEKVL